MEKSNKELLYHMRKLRIDLEEFRVREWRVARTKYLQTIFDLLNSHGKL